MDEDGGVTHVDIKAAIYWLRLAVSGLAGVGAFAIFLLYGQIQDSRAVASRMEEQGAKAIENLSGTLSTTNSVLQTAVIRLEGIGEMVKRNSLDIRDHVALTVERAHGFDSERKK